MDEDKVLQKTFTILASSLTFIQLDFVDGILVNSGNKAFFLRAQLENIEILFHRFQVILKVNSDADLDIMEKEYTYLNIFF